MKIFLPAAIADSKKMIEGKCLAVTDQYIVVCRAQLKNNAVYDTILFVPRFDMDTRVMVEIDDDGKELQALIDCGNTAYGSTTPELIEAAQTAMRNTPSPIPVNCTQYDHDPNEGGIDEDDIPF